MSRIDIASVFQRLTGQKRIQAWLSHIAELEKSAKAATRYGFCCPHCTALDYQVERSEVATDLLSRGACIEHLKCSACGFTERKHCSSMVGANSFPGG